LPELTTFLRFPREHWQRIRHTNLIERTFGETRRRIKVIGRLPGERSCLSLVWAVLDRAARGWRGVVMTPAAVRLLQELRRQLHHPARLQEVVDQPVTPAAYHAPSGARARPRSTRSGTPPPVRTPSPKPLSSSTRPRWTGTQTVVLVGDNLPTMGEADDCSIPAGNRLRRSGLAGRFWAAALGYELEPPPTGFTSWDDYWREVGVAMNDPEGNEFDIN
jgi:Transposase, Mutator family